MAAPATAPNAIRKPVLKDLEGRNYYALSFGSSVARLWLDPRKCAHGAAHSGSGGFTEGDLVCGMLGPRAELLARLWREGTISRLVDLGLLAAVEPVTSPQNGFGFTLRLTRTPAISHGHEWCGEMWKAAALLIIDLIGALAKEDLTLRSPNPWYVLFDGTRPCYINPASIGLFDEPAYHAAIHRLHRGFLYPLHFCAKGQSRLARTLQRSLYGIHAEDFPELSVWEQRQQQDLEDLTPEEFLTRLRSEVEAIELPESQSSYEALELPFKPNDRWGYKHWTIHGVLKSLNPRTVLDLASNTGWFARLAALEGAEVIAADLDEACVNRMYRQARHDNSCVLPLVLDLVDPSPGVGMNQGWLMPASERLRADLVLALAISHHLVLSGLRLNFDQVAEGFARFSKRWLLMEFIPFGSENNAYNRSSRPDCVSWYDLEHFTRAIDRYFRRISVLPGPQRSRKLLLCEK